MNRNFGDRWPDVVTEVGPYRTTQPGRAVIALHCSGTDGSQWRNLAAAFGPQFKIIAPSLIGSGDAARHWSGEHAFTLIDEAWTIIELINSLAGPVHLVGHFYGGGVALKVANMRPARVASLALYEPSAFHILRQLGTKADDALTEIENLTAIIRTGIVTGAYRHAAAAFVDYWNGVGSWSSLRPEARDALIRWLPKAPLDFHALIEDDTLPARLRHIVCPVLLMRGEHARRPSRRIVDELMGILPNGSLEVLEGAGHMGPLTHRTAVNRCIATHITSAVTDRTTDADAAAIAA